MAGLIIGDVAIANLGNPRWGCLPLPVFRKALGILKKPESALSLVPTPSRGCGLEGPSSKMQIIVISQEQETCQFICQVLNDAGYDVFPWLKDAEAIDFSQICEPTIVILDVASPIATSSPEFWSMLRQESARSPLFCLLLAEAESLSTCLKGVEQGLDDYLLKPFGVDELMSKIYVGRRILDLKQELLEQKQLLETELSEAVAYVRSLLPNNLTDKIPIQARFIPSRLLGGDCYDYYWLDPDYLVMYVLDVSGHGIGSALLSTSVLNILRSQSLPDVNFYRPEKVLKGLNETFQMNDQNEKYFTIWYGVYNRANRQLLYASAGHPPAVLLTCDRTQSTQLPILECLKTSGLPIGMMPDVQYAWQRCHIPPDSRLYLFSDGVYEIKQANNTIMGLNDFLDILSQHTFDKNIDHLLQEVSRRNQGFAFSDDLSLLEIYLD